jgi:hypothetical protein
MHVAEDGEQDRKLESHDKKGHQGHHRFAADDQGPARGGESSQQKSGEKPDDTAGQGKPAHLAFGQFQGVFDDVAGDGAVDPFDPWTFPAACRWPWRHCAHWKKSP